MCNMNVCIICGAPIYRRSGKLCSDKCRDEYYRRLDDGKKDPRSTWRQWYLQNREHYNAYQNERHARQYADMNDDARRELGRYQVKARRPDDYPRSQSGRALNRPKSTRPAALLRFARGMTIPELSKMCGVSVAIIGRFERTGTANDATIAKLASALGVTSGVLTGKTPIPSDIPVTYPSPMQRARWAAGLTQAQLANIIQRPKVMIEIWESGRSYPDAETLARIAQALNISIEELNNDG